MNRHPGSAGTGGLGDSPVFRRALARSIALPLIAAVLLALVLGAMVGALLRQLDAIDQSDRALAALHRAEQLLLQVERGARGFLSTGSEDALEPFTAALPALEAQFAELAALVDGPPDAGGASVRPLRERYDEWRRGAERHIAERRLAAAVPHEVLAGADEQRMDALRADLAVMGARERQRRRARQEAAERATRGTLGAAIAGVILLGAALAYHARRQLVSLAANDAASHAALRRSETELRATLESGGFAIAQVDPITHRILHVNRVMEPLTGYSKAELLAMRVPDLTHPEDRDADLAALQRLTDGGAGRARLETRLVRKDGAIRWVHAEATRIPPLGEAPARAVVFLTDVTERRRAEEALRERDARVRQLLAGVPQLIWTCRASGACEYLSPQWLAYTGGSEAEQLGDGWLDGIHPDDRGQVVATWRAAVAAGTPMSAEYRLRRRDGQYRWFDVRLIPLHDPLGRVQSWVGSSHDIEERRRAEAAVHTLNATLEQRVAECRAQLEEATRELEAFSYAVSHDLRSPLRRIDGFAELLTQAVAEGRSDTLSHYAGRIGAEAQRAGQLIDDLLAFARAGRSALRLQRVDPGRLVDEVRETLGGADGRRVEWEIAPLPPVTADPAMLRVVFANLLSNAVKYTAPREVARIRIASWRRARDTVFSVEDNGVGFDMRFAGQLFGLFQRLHLADEFEGSGIGLALVRRIVARHGGQTWAEAEEGRGATVSFSLPDQPEAAGSA